MRALTHPPSLLSFRRTCRRKKSLFQKGVRFIRGAVEVHIYQLYAVSTRRPRPFAGSNRQPLCGPLSLRQRKQRARSMQQRTPSPSRLEARTRGSSCRLREAPRRSKARPRRTSRTRRSSASRKREPFCRGWLTCRGGLNECSPGRMQRGGPCSWRVVDQSPSHFKNLVAQHYEICQ